MRNRIFIIISCLLFVGVLSLIVTNKDNERQEEFPKVRLGIQIAPAVGLVKVAIEKRFFRDQGLDVEVSEFTSGRDAMQALFGGSLELAFPAEFPVTLATLNGNEVLVMGHIAQTREEVRIVARIEEKLTDAREYFLDKRNKRKLAVLIGGGPEFFVHEYFKKHGISIEDVELVSMKPADMPAALASRSVDAISIFEPFATLAEERLEPGSTMSFSDSEVYSETLLVVGDPEFVNKNPEVIEKFLRSLVNAESYMREHRTDSVKIVSAFTKLDEKIVEKTWDSFGFGVGLQGSLLDVMRAQMLWAQEQKIMKEGAPIPNFREIIFDEPLKKIDRKRVRL